jgi:hypothetical protein
MKADHAIRFGDWEWIEDDSLEDGEYRRGRPNAEGESGYGRHGEQRAAAQETDTVADVLQHVTSLQDAGPDP